MARHPQHLGRSPQRAGGPVLCRPDRCPENSPARASQTKDAGCGQGTHDYSYRSGPPVAHHLKGQAARQCSAQSMMRNTVAPNPSTASQDSAAPKQLTPKQLTPKPLAPKARGRCLMPPKVHRPERRSSKPPALRPRKRNQQTALERLSSKPPAFWSRECNQQKNSERATCLAEQVTIRAIAVRSEMSAASQAATASKEMAS